MSPTDKGSTPESPETPEPNWEPIPGEGAPVEPIADASDSTEAVSDAGQDESMVDLTKHESEVDADATAAPEADPVGTPIGGDYPAPEDFASASAPASSNKKVIAIISGLVVLVMIALGIWLLVAIFSDDNDSSEAQIKRVTSEVLDAQNSGELSKIPALTCEKVLESLPPNPEDTEPAPQQVEIVEVGAIRIDGDTATATVTIAAKDDPSMPARAEIVTYENEDGWKLCG